LELFLQSLLSFDGIKFFLVFVCGFIGSSVNAFAGGGTFLAFPALLASGLPPIIANATCKVAFIPGNLASCWAYRHSFANAKTIIAGMLLIAFIGGTSGALLTLYMGNDNFKKFIPWLILMATLLAWYGPMLTKILQKDTNSYMSHSVKTVSQIMLVLTSFYGGFFGAGIGVLLIATLTIRGITDINLINAIKNLMSVLINLAAIIMYIYWGTVDWGFACVQMTGAILGGYAGGVIGQNMHPQNIRRMIMCIGFSLSAIYFYQYYA
jgi:uncharacterized membrane protein YfcA